MRTRTLVVLGFGAYAVFLAATLPARLLAQRLAVPGALAIEDAKGTVWHGSARAVLGTGEPAVVLDPVRWRFLPSRLASGRLAFAVEASGPGVSARGEIGRGVRAYEALDVEARVDASAVAAIAPLAAGWRPGGTIALAAPMIAWNGQEARGRAQLEWTNATLALSDVRPLGSYRIEAHAGGGPAAISVATIEGPLRIAGRGTFAPPDGLDFSAEARADAAQAAALEPLLGLIGPKRPDGARGIEWRSVAKVPPRT